ncbi:MAG: reverse transcriptase domain-containing protein [Patescibacteria group bacterium]
MNQWDVNVVNSHNNKVVNNYDDLITLENLFLSWKEFKKGKSKRKDVQEFEFNLEDNIFQLYYELKDKTYKHSNYSSFFIQDPKLRHIHKAKIKDRIVHHLIAKYLEQVFNKSFIFDSYSCRKNKGTHKAVNRLKSFCLKKSKNNKINFYYLKCDIKKFFDNLDHNILINILKRKIEDKDILNLIEEIINSFYKGIPLGNLTSQWFANIYLNELDRFIKHKLKIKYYLRYTDDFVILNKSKKDLEKLISVIEKFLRTNLKLSLHPDKITIRKYNQGIDFLGYVVLPYYIVLRTKTKKRIFKKIKLRIKQFKNNQIVEQCLNQSIQSYFGVLKHCNSYKLRRELEKFIKQYYL